MQINFNVTGSDRKALVQAIDELLAVKPKYLGLPGANYKIGSIIVDKNGTFMNDASVSNTTSSWLIKELNARGFIGEVTDRGDSEIPPAEDDADTPADDLVIELPRDGFTETAIANLEKLVESKATLIKKAIGADSLSTWLTDETICFPWLQPDTPAEVIKAATQLIVALCNMAKEQKRITATAKEVENEKYAFRCFLLRLGFIGNEYKEARKILLSRLDGNTAFKSGRCES